MTIGAQRDDLHPSRIFNSEEVAEIEESLRIRFGRCRHEESDEFETVELGLMLLRRATKNRTLECDQAAEFESASKASQSLIESSRSSRAWSEHVKEATKKQKGGGYGRKTSSRCLMPHQSRRWVGG